MKKQWTRKQHFVSCMILKHYTYFQIPMRKPIIYQYAKEKDICRVVDIYDICRTDNLYEFRNEDGSIKESMRNDVKKLNDYIINTCNGRFIYSSVSYNQILKGD